MNALSKLRSRIAPGVIITCVENTFQPKRNGCVQMIHLLIGKDRVTCLTEHGDPAILHLPKKASEVRWLDRDTVQWDFKAHGRVTLPGHTVTYRFGCALCHSPDHDTKRNHACTMDAA